VVTMYQIWFLWQTKTFIW